MKRKLDKGIQNKLVTSPLWLNEIEIDCKQQKVFAAIRNNQIDFYHKGGRLFCFDKNDYKTHLKYASVITSNGDDYLTEVDLASHSLASDFKTSYSRIKENCSNYSGIEASGVADIYHRHSYLSSSDVVVLDIEVSFESTMGNGKQDRIDILLLNKLTKRLQFVEVKHYSNSEIWSSTTPKVLSQIKRYESQIKLNKSQILSEYATYIDTLNDLFKTTLPIPTDIDDKVTLFIFGFDNDQKNGRLKSHIIENPKFKGVKTYALGNANHIVPENLWKAKIL